jgi:hypothetical protein
VKRQELLRQLDQEVEGLKRQLGDVSKRLAQFQEEEIELELRPRVLDPKEKMQDKDFVFWGNTQTPTIVDKTWGIGMEVKATQWIRGTIVVRP